METDACKREAGANLTCQIWVHFHLLFLTFHKKKGLTIYWQKLLKLNIKSELCAYFIHHLYIRWNINNYIETVFFFVTISFI